MAVGFRKRVKYNKGPSRRTQQQVPGARNNIQPGTPINAGGTVVTGEQASITLDQPVSLNGIPQWPDGSAPPQLPVGAHLNDLRTGLTLQYSVAPVSPITVPFQDPAIRNQTAGYVNPTSLTFGG